jgi:outer membrane receptor protein involved in Fe transport
MPDTVSSIYEGNCSTCGQLGQYRPNDLVGLETQVKVKAADAGEFTVGASAERESLARDYSSVYSGDPLARPAEPGSPAMVSNELLSLYGQGHYHLLPELVLTAGLRQDNSSSYGRVATPRAGLVYSEGKYALKLLYTEAFRAPRPWDYNYGSGNSALEPEKMRSWEIAANCAVSDNLMTNLTLYRSRLEGLLEISGDRWVNSGLVYTRGAGLRAEYARGAVKGYLNYAFQASEDENGSDVPEISRHTAGAGALYAFGRRVKLNVDARYTGGRKNTKPIAAAGVDRVGAALVTDAALSLGGSGDLVLRLMAKNLFNTRYYHTSNRPPDRYRQPPRQLLLQLNYAFGASL